MKEKYDYIILPPDTDGQTLSDGLADNKFLFESIVYAVEKYKNKDETLLIKYRWFGQKRSYKISSEIDLPYGYGNIIDYCTLSTKIIGPIGSATVEALQNKLMYFCYKSNGLASVPGDYTYNDFVFSGLSKAFIISKSSEELICNLKEGNIFCDGYSFSDIFKCNGKRLDEIVLDILTRQRLAKIN